MASEYAFRKRIARAISRSREADGRPAHGGESDLENAVRDAGALQGPDADTLGQCVLESLEELKDSASDSRPRAPRGRKKAVPTDSDKAGKR